MQATAKGQRRRGQRKAAEAAVVRLEMKDGMGNPRWVTADLVDTIDGGCGLSLMTLLKSGSTVVVRGRVGENGVADRLEAGVRWCVEDASGAFRAGLEFLGSHTGGAHRAEAEPESAEAAIPANCVETLDCYEVMQLSPNADADTVARVYRMLAVRYHPDNVETGNREMFLRLAEAHAILSDPEKRAKYDVAHREGQRLRWKIFDRAAVAEGSEGEKRKRHGILALLYAKMLSNPEQAELNIQAMEELLGCPREHLQAALWYLKGKNYIARGDNGRYAITIAGFEEAEARQVVVANAEAARVGADHQLPEAAQA